MIVVEYFIVRIIIIILSVFDLFYCSGLTVHVEERYLIKCRKYHALLYSFLKPNQIQILAVLCHS